MPLSLAILSNISATNEFMTFIAFFEIPISE
jgi:hypothetical protein